jgi:hypothetical protein
MPISWQVFNGWRLTLLPFEFVLVRILTLLFWNAFRNPGPPPGKKSRDHLCVACDKSWVCRATFVSMKPGDEDAGAFDFLSWFATYAVIPAPNLSVTRASLIVIVVAKNRGRMYAAGFLLRLLAT